MRIGVTGGKGGTGKSTVATALAFKLARKEKVLLLDLDVDCPNDNLILGIKTKKVKNVENMIPKFDFKKCIKCGRCSQVCREHAIVFVKNKYPILIPEQCIGCKACEIACPVNAISKAKQKIGEVLQGKEKNLTLLSGKMKPGVEESSLVVNAVKKYAQEKEKKYKYVIIDTAAGTHCPVISALLGCDIALAVAEPTPLGNHDLELILRLTKILKIKSYIVLNRADIGDKKIIERTARKYKTEIIAEIPYSKEIEKRYAEGRPIEHEAIEKIIDFIKQIEA